jgi:2-(3-amino-3-carboxypropyl)histidine synthase
VVPVRIGIYSQDMSLDLSMINKLSTIPPTSQMTEENKPRKSNNAAKPRKRFIGSKSATPSKPGMAATISHQIPQDILLDDQLNSAIRQLPSNYSFEIHKTIHHIRKNNATMVAMQMPEGLQMFACAIADIIERCASSIHWLRLHFKTSPLI